MVMPIANMFGHDTMKNFAYCIQNMQTNFMGPMLTPSNYSNALAASNIGALNISNSNSMGMFGNIRGLMGNNIMGMFNVFGNISLLMGLMVNKIKDMMNKLGVYSLQHSQSCRVQHTLLSLHGMQCQEDW